jgi:hypothetical protein
MAHLEDGIPDQREERSLTTDIAIGLGPTLAVGAEAVKDWLTDRPPKEEPPKVELPPGVDLDGD